jgi:hypothetical protein
MAGEKPEFGKRRPRPVITHRPKGDGANPVAAQKRSLAITLCVTGALALGTYEAVDWLDRKLNCEPDPNNPEELVCKHSSGSSYRRSRSSWRSSSYSSSSSTHGVSFGGFGHAGGSHSSGG